MRFHRHDRPQSDAAGGRSECSCYFFSGSESNESKGKRSDKNVVTNTFGVTAFATQGKMKEPEIEIRLDLKGSNHGGLNPFDVVVVLLALKHLLVSRIQ